jgi:hypothetical protein
MSRLYRVGSTILAAGIGVAIFSLFKTFSSNDGYDFAYILPLLLCLPVIGLGALLSLVALVFRNVHLQMLEGYKLSAEFREAAKYDLDRLRRIEIITLCLFFPSYFFILTPLNLLTPLLPATLIYCAYMRRKIKLYIQSEAELSALSSVSPSEDQSQ